VALVEKASRDIACRSRQDGWLPLNQSSGLAIGLDKSKMSIVFTSLAWHLILIPETSPLGPLPPPAHVARCAPENRTDGPSVVLRPLALSSAITPPVHPAVRPCDSPAHLLTIRDGFCTASRGSVPSSTPTLQSNIPSAASLLPLHAAPRLTHPRRRVGCHFRATRVRGEPGEPGRRSWRPRRVMAGLASPGPSGWVSFAWLQLTACLHPPVRLRSCPSRPSRPRNHETAP
jgi:hypothetical protein